MIHPTSCFQNEASKSSVLANNSTLYPAFNHSSPLLLNNGLNLNSGYCPSQSIINNGRCDTPAFSSVQNIDSSICMFQKNKKIADTLHAYSVQIPKANSLFAVLQNANTSNTRPLPSIHHQNTWNSSFCVDLSAPVFRESNISFNPSSPQQIKEESQTIIFNVESMLKIKSEPSDSCESSPGDDEVDKVFSTKRMYKLTP